MQNMEEFYATLFSTLVVIGFMAALYVLQRNHTRRLMQDLKETILRESDRQEANTQKLADAVKEFRTHLVNIIKKDPPSKGTPSGKSPYRLTGDAQHVEDRLQNLDDRVREVEGDMKVVKHRLRIYDGHPPGPSKP